MNAINHLRGDRVAKVVVESIASHLVASGRYKVIQRAIAAINSEEVSGAIEWTANRDEKLQRAKNQGVMNG